MVAKGQSYAEKHSRWQVLITNAKPNVPDMPYIDSDVTALSQKLDDVRALESKQEDLRSQVRDLVKQIQTATRDGEKIRSRLGATLKGKYGFQSDALVKYGFKPRPQSIRRTASKPTPEPPPAGQPETKPPGTTGGTGSTK
jgi:outer membrane murein-binding lipoprotein Lpp